jgi:hypothetical protein
MPFELSFPSGRFLDDDKHNPTILRGRSVSVAHWSSEFSRAPAALLRDIREFASYRFAFESFTAVPELLPAAFAGMRRFALSRCPRSVTSFRSRPPVLSGSLTNGRSSLFTRPRRTIANSCSQCCGQSRTGCVELFNMFIRLVERGPPLQVAAPLQNAGAVLSARWMVRCVLELLQSDVSFRVKADGMRSLCHFFGGCRHDEK